MPLHVEGRSDLVVCGLSGKRRFGSGTLVTRIRSGLPFAVCPFFRGPTKVVLLLVPLYILA